MDQGIFLHHFSMVTEQYNVGGIRDPVKKGLVTGLQAWLKDYKTIQKIKMREMETK